MTNVRRALARLNPRAQSLNGASGGIPELTATDVAGALGMVHDNFSRDILCAIWWPEGASLIRDRILTSIANKQRAEMERQSGEVYISRLELHLGGDTQDAGSLAQMRARVRRAQDGMWDARAILYTRSVCAAVFDEMSKPNTCRECDGVGYTIGVDKVHICAKCDGAGIRPLKNSDRARMLGVSEKNYVRHGIRRVYDWTYALVRDAEQSGALQLQRALK